MQVGESVVNAIVEYHAQGSEGGACREGKQDVPALFARVNGNTAWRLRWPEIFFSGEGLI